MTLEQIEHIIGEEYGYALDSWIPMQDITVISFINDANLFCDFNTMRFKFNTTTSLLEVAYGKVVNDSFISSGGLSEDYTPESYVDFEEIQGILSSVWLAPHGGFLQRGF